MANWKIKNYSRQKATAPYNFVALPEKILPAPFTFNDLDDFKMYMAGHENLSGEIFLTITTKTPLFIGGNATENFAPVNKPIIPGSSLRGMLKNIFKIVTCGAFRGGNSAQKKGVDFNDEQLYFRCLMAPKGCYSWMTELNKHYNDLMTDKVTENKRARPGFLIRTSDDKYFIVPLKKDSPKKEYILMKDYQEQFGPVKFRDSKVRWVGSLAYSLTGNQWANKPEKLLDAEQYEKYKNFLNDLRDKLKAGTITKEQYTKEIANNNHGKQIIRTTKIEYADWSRRLEITDEVLTSYRNDRNRNGLDLLKCSGKKNEGILEGDDLRRRAKGNLPPDVKSLIPCHYLTEDGKITAFGHGQCFRIPYANKIGCSVPKALQSDEIIDFTDAVFGKEKFWASRVYFEDATTSAEPQTLNSKPAHPLMQPNPTSYQLYLKQDDKKLKYWDSVGSQIRGYKLYWHNKPNDYDWQATPDERLTKEITPLKAGNVFTSKIRFKNLSAIELGALMMIFDLDGYKGDTAYKIGQGKPLGLGSIKIEPTLYIENETAYTELFNADGWKKPYRKENPDAYLNKFKDYIDSRNMSKTWQKVMEELQMILDWNQTKHKDWSDKVKSMSGDVSTKGGVDERFKSRAPLQDIKTIFEVMEK